MEVVPYMKLGGDKFILTSFLIWRLTLFFIVFLGIAILTLQKYFLGGGLDNYLKNPYFWSLLNFDGEHYAAIALNGYQPLTYFFFPLYPLLARFVASLINKDFITIAISGVLVSNLAFLIGLFGLWKLIRLDYKDRIAKLTILLLLLFPTSFYFGAFYTEGLAFALIVWSFYFARTKKWFLCGIFGALATATRITALALVPALAIEFFHQRQSPITNYHSLITSVNFKKVLCFFLIPTGLTAYMYYLYRVTGDPLEFIHNVSIFGEQRSSSLVVLPQVFYRYIFKVLPNINYSYLPIVFTTYLEIVSAGLFLVLGILSFYKLRLSYALFFAAGYLIPPLSGSFSSFPRYVLILFPAFLLAAIFLEGQSRFIKMAVCLILLVLLFLSFGFFARGYWVS